MSRLRVDGTRFVRADDGVPFEWRGITAFRLLEMIAGDREAEATAFLDWAAAKQLTIVRVLTMAHHLFRLAPEDGRRALPRLLELAASRGLYVEIVALADTNSLPADLEAHVRAIGEIAADHANALVEIANEPVHPTQQARVHDPAFLQRLAELVPDEVPVAYGSTDDSDANAGGDYATVHLSRDTNDGGWAHVTALASAASLVERWAKPVISDEPIGAAAEFQPGRRDNDPARFRAAALLTRLAGLGATFHHEGGLHARIPAGVELACFDAWNEAWTLLPADIESRGRFHAGGADILTIAGTDRHLFLRQSEREVWAVLVGPGPESPLTLADGWTLAGTQSPPGATVVRATRQDENR